MATDIRKIIVQTGNIIDMEDQIRLVGQSSSEELKGCVKSALGQWSSKPSTPSSSDEGGGGGVVVIQAPRQPLLYSAAKGISTTAKIFLSEENGRHAVDAIKTVCSNVGRSSIESVIVSPPDVSDDVPLSQIQNTWGALEEAVREGLVCRIGIADVSFRLFKELFQWAQIKPSIIQVNLASCCSVPEGLNDFARDNDVQVLTHTDDADMLDEDTVSSILTRVGVPEVDCQVQWLARHRTIHVCFGLVLDKGYTIAIDCCSTAY